MKFKILLQFKTRIDEKIIRCLEEIQTNLRKNREFFKLLKTKNQHEKNTQIHTNTS